jgi:hypothetical protein
MPRPEGRAIAVAELLRAGWTGAEVSAGLKVADTGGTPQEAMQAMEDARRAASSPSKSKTSKSGEGR